MAERRKESGSNDDNPDDGTATAHRRALLQDSLLSWSDKQGHILTGGGTMSKWYRAPRFPFTEDELPHYHKARGTSRLAFAAWRGQGTLLGAGIAGAWRRPLFVGGWTHSDGFSSDGETTFNLQTPSVFLDMRIPKAGEVLLRHHRGFHTMTDLELRLFARRHAFAGFTRVSPVHPEHSYSSHPPANASNRVNGNGVHDGEREDEKGTGVDRRIGVVEAEPTGEKGGLLATRHHAIDWNYVGAPRPRPNKWRVEMGPGGNTWREWGFAKDNFDQHIYMERWQRLPGGGGPFFAMRRRAMPSSRRSGRDAMLIVCGDHFGLIIDRSPELLGDEGARSGGLVALVDDAIAGGSRDKAVEFLSLEASHGRISSHNGTKPWTVDCSLHPWLQGHRPFAGTIVTISPSGRSVHWSKRNRNPGDEGASGQSRPSNDERNAWLGRSVDGVWDVVENTLVNRVAARAVAGLLENCGAAVCIGEEESPEGSGQIGLQGTDDAGLRAKL